MQMPPNAFKQRLLAGEPQTGIWLGLTSPYAAEIAATAGFDWLLLDVEHAPNDLTSLLAQLQAMEPYASHPVVRPPTGDAVLLKRYLDIGVQNLLIPMVETPEQAAELVAATRYPPRGKRGVGHVLARASRWGQVEDYLWRADDEICLLLQVESPEALDNLEAIAAVDGVDGVFVGPADLSAAMGQLGNPGHPEVVAVISDAIARIRATGKAAGIVTADEREARDYLEAGCTFVGVGIDTLMLASALRGLAGRFASR
ncbi:4-hydroxy-2-oxoheptanedioate aldolase [Halomonas urumqiensis]|uniref:4-hydroxy-2-oxoheptanedioate aldolase n=1 Tax=Halomonas urumqiensis TaxID=1684789 RepID=A0A2N7UQ52_9GAMM|nr:4-hydroxy-2-oxoheptanedioate aldolase [Halomonas urumqiensis]PMR82564.1 4-hydroxy-2-oxoheptanedioate aldolase [Halomonas urumqiensis]PTB01021.1 4-hydroxy-2-oxoheptanedioate aldolase [Halomonas urumqiensis]GHE22906.1 2,4-dihydroxyhept-2-ene-1,7-dioic acid aldolase [Halomonas urumqiensis]